MGLPQTAFLLLLSHLAFLLDSASAQLPPAAAPSYRHHKPHHPSTTYPPAKPPLLPPVKPPTKPPVKPPTKPPTNPPVKPPIKPPTYPPVHPPTYPPVKPPVHIPPPTKPVTVQGVVYCKNCSYSGVDTLLGSKPLPGATVVLMCRSFKSVVTKKVITDKNGYFFMEAPKGVVSYKATKYCHVYLAGPAAGATCRHATNINGGRKGGLLKPQETFAPLPYDLFSVGPFAYEPAKRHCRRTAYNEEHVQPQFGH